MGKYELKDDKLNCGQMCNNNVKCHTYTFNKNDSMC